LMLGKRSKYLFYRIIPRKKPLRTFAGNALETQASQ